MTHKNEDFRDTLNALYKARFEANLPDLMAAQGHDLREGTEYKLALMFDVIRLYGDGFYIETKRQVSIAWLLTEGLIVLKHKPCKTIPRATLPITLNVKVTYLKLSVYLKGAYDWVYVPEQTLSLRLKFRTNAYLTRTGYKSVGDDTFGFSEPPSCNLLGYNERGATLGNIQLGHAYAVPEDIRLFAMFTVDYTDKKAAEVDFAFPVTYQLPTTSKVPSTQGWGAVVRCSGNNIGVLLPKGVMCLFNLFKSKFIAVQSDEGLGHAASHVQARINLRTHDVQTLEMSASFMFADAIDSGTPKGWAEAAKYTTLLNEWLLSDNVNTIAAQGILPYLNGTFDVTLNFIHAVLPKIKKNPSAYNVTFTYDSATDKGTFTTTKLNQE